MLKKRLQHYLPNPDRLKQHKNLQFLGQKLHQASLWHFSRRSVSKAMAVGLFCAWIPVPAQMALAATAALYFQANLALAVALVWLTNPLTTPPLFYFAYHVGLAFLDRTETDPLQQDFSFTSLINHFSDIGGVFLYGCFICAVISALVGYIAVRLYWGFQVSVRWKNRTSLKNKL